MTGAKGAKQPGTACERKSRNRCASPLGGGDVITYTLTVTNNAAASLSGAVLSDPLPQGTTYVPGSASAGEYDPGTRTLTWRLPDLAPGASATLTFQVRVAGTVRGEILNRATLTVADATPTLTAVAGVRLLPPPTEAFITPTQGGRLTAAEGRVELRFPPGAVDRPVVTRFVPRVRARSGFLLTFDLEAHTQADGAPVTSFQQPVTITIRYTAQDEAWLRARSVVVPLSPTLLFFDPAQQQWVPVQGTLDREQRIFTAQLTHFSSYAFGETNFEPGIQPTVKGFQVSLFTGDGPRPPCRGDSPRRGGRGVGCRCTPHRGRAG